MMKKRKKIQTLFLFVCIFLLFLIVGIYIYLYSSGKSFMDTYKNKVYPNSYISGVAIGDMNDHELSLYLVSLEEKIKNIKLNINVNDKNYNYTLGDLGVYINKEEILRNVLLKKEKNSLYASIMRLFHGGVDTYNYKIVYSEVSIKDFVNLLKKQVDIEGLSGELKMKNRTLSYEGYREGYSLDKEKVIRQIESAVYKSLKNENIDDIKVINVKAKGEKIDKSNKDLSSINKKVASFSTKYYHSMGEKNLEMALSFIDQVVVMPNDTFSFFNYVGPYDKAGYVEYDGLVGNGVCQVSTTLYNALLLTGIKATERSVHSDVSEYVPGGMDAMVSSLDGKNTTDFQFINTLDYPIYISAYLTEDKVCIDIWSNENALLDKVYKVESIRIDSYTYQSYLYTYDVNGVLLKKDLLGVDSYR